MGRGFTVYGEAMGAETPAQREKKRHKRSQSSDTLKTLKTGHQTPGLHCQRHEYRGGQRGGQAHLPKKESTLLQRGTDRPNPENLRKTTRMTTRWSGDFQTKDPQESPAQSSIKNIPRV